MQSYHIHYSTNPASIAAHQLQGFFVGWNRHPSAMTHKALLESSDFAVMAIDRSTNRVVGFITAITDGVLSASIPFLEVLPEYQGRGIGSELVRGMLRQLAHFYMVDLVCEESLISFYSRFGFAPCRAMSLRRYDRVPGREEVGHTGAAYPSESDSTGIARAA